MLATLISLAHAGPLSVIIACVTVYALTRRWLSHCNDIMTHYDRDADAADKVIRASRGRRPSATPRIPRQRVHDPASDERPRAG